MKKLLLLSVLFLAIIGCSKGNDEPVVPVKENKLIGTWKYVEYIGILGNNVPPNLIANGYTIKFNSDFTFSSNEVVNYPTGTYTIPSANVVTLTYISSGNVNYVRTKKIDEVTGVKLILNPTDRSCDEGCGERYEKI